MKTLKLISACLYLIAWAGMVFAVDYTSIQSTGQKAYDWTLASSWTPGGGPPGAGDNAYIPSGSNIFVPNGRTVYCTDLVVSGLLQIKATGGSIGVLVISGDVTNNGIIDGSTGAVASGMQFTSGDHYISGTGTFGTANKPLNFSTAAGATLIFDATASLGGSGTFTLGTDSTISTANPVGLNGSIAVTGTVTLPASTDYIFNGTTAQVTGTLLPSTVNNVTIDNPVGVTFSNATTIDGTLYHVDGYIAGGPLAVDGYSSEYLTIGETGEYLQNFEVTLSATADPELYPDSVNRSWSIYSTTTGVTKELTFYWTAAEDYNYPWSDEDPPHVYINGTWYAADSYDYSSDPRSLTISLDSFAITEDILIGRGDGAMLPVELSSFTAVLSATNFIQLQWVTQSETNVAGYRLYRNTSHDLETAQMLNAFIEATNTFQMQIYVYWDTEVYEDGTYYYWLQNLDFDGSSCFHGPISITVAFGNTGTPAIPINSGINRIYPNPFNPSTFIEVGIMKAAETSIQIYNQRGQLVRNLFSGFKDKGTHLLFWDGTDNQGRALPGGIYLIRMNISGERSQRKVVLVK